MNPWIKTLTDRSAVEEEHDEAIRETALRPRRIPPRQRETKVLPGTLDVLVLKALERRRLTEYAIRKHIKEVSAGTVVVPQSSLIKAIHRLAQARWIRRYRSNSKGRKTKVYMLASGSRSHVQSEVRKLTRKLNALLAFIGS